MERWTPGAGVCCSELPHPFKRFAKDHSTNHERVLVDGRLQSSSRSQRCLCQVMSPSHSPSRLSTSVRLQDKTIDNVRTCVSPPPERRHRKEQEIRDREPPLGHFPETVPKLFRNPFETVPWTPPPSSSYGLVAVRSRPRLCIRRQLLQTPILEAPSRLHNKVSFAEALEDDSL